jgi:hypothetical protein
LHAVPIKRDGLPFEGTDEEMCHPSLVFSAELVKTIDTTHAKDHHGNRKGTGIIQYILVCGALGTSIWAMKIQRTVLINTVATDEQVLRLIARTILGQADVTEIAIDFVGGGKHQSRWIVHGTQRLKEVKSAAGIDFEIEDWIGQACGHCHLGGKMIDLFGRAYGPAQGIAIADVCHLDL